MLRLIGRRRRLEDISKWIYTTQRHRSGGCEYIQKALPSSYYHQHDDSFPAQLHTRRLKQKNHVDPPLILPRSHLHPHAEISILRDEDVISYFQSGVSHWATKLETLGRLTSFGLPDGDSRKLLEYFTKTVQSGALSNPENFRYYQLSRICMPPPESTTLDVIYSTTFFWWAARHENRKVLERDVGIHSGTLDSIQNLVQLTDRSFPADEFPTTRKTRRTVIMHVGPTNSGKTHHALRALAAAPSGVYAGPLRLLAHEIWERLNTGQIIPLGVELEHSRKQPSPDSRLGNQRYVRLCNMVTGEEQKYMGENVPLLSCTIEMLSHQRFWDVAVVDEIQMLGDLSRGNAWLNAVLGINARELHLCGEETAIPIVRELLKHTGDEIIVNRYERLSPLEVEDKSLEGDLTKVQKGDCIVAFSRTAIFRIKKLVERKTGMRCAVVYGRLPPEVRSEQAALFNDPNSGYDVLIGSDAIGMGLNLKIKRIVFEAVSKWDGGADIPLPVSSVKQIAGRAGRFGLHGLNGDAGGTVTTLRSEDLPYLKECVAQPYKPLPYAHISQNEELFSAISQALPEGSTMNAILEASVYAGRLPLVVRYSVGQKDDICQFINDHWSDMTNKERLQLLNAPIPWRDTDATMLITRMLRMHRERMRVNLRMAISNNPSLKIIDREERDMTRGNSSSEPLAALVRLEAFHKAIVFYMWMSFRYPVIYADYDAALQLKVRVEKVLNWCLENLTPKLSKKEAKRMVAPRTVRPSDGLSYMTKAERRRQAMSQTDTPMLKLAAS